MAKAIRISELDHWGENEVEGLLIPASEGSTVTKSVSATYIVSGSQAFRELSYGVGDLSYDVVELSYDVTYLDSYVANFKEEQTIIDNQQNQIIDDHSAYIYKISYDAAHIDVWENY